MKEGIGKLSLEGNTLTAIARPYYDPIRQVQVEGQLERGGAPLPKATH